MSSLYYFFCFFVGIYSTDSRLVQRQGCSAYQQKAILLLHLCVVYTFLHGNMKLTYKYSYSFKFTCECESGISISKHHICLLHAVNLHVNVIGASKILATIVIRSY